MTVPEPISRAELEQWVAYSDRATRVVPPFIPTVDLARIALAQHEALREIAATLAASPELTNTETEILNVAEAALALITDTEAT